MIIQDSPQRLGSAVDTAAQGLSRLIESGTGLTGQLQWKIIVSSLVILALVFLRRLVLRIVDKRVEDRAARYRWSKVSGYTAFIVVLFVIGSIWLEGLRQLGTFFGLLSAGVAIALKDLLANLAGWIFILWRRPFELGDRIQVGEDAGDVVDVRIFQFTLLEIGRWVDADQSTGRIIHVPNAKVFMEPLANYTAGFEYLWHEVSVLVTFESNWRKAKGILEGVAAEVVAGVVEEAEASIRRASRKWLIFYNNLTPVVYTAVKDSGVMLTVRFLVKPRSRRGKAQEMWEGILEAFHQEPDIDLAYPTQRLYYNQLEGKPEARAPLPAELADLAPEGDGRSGAPVS